MPTSFRTSTCLQFGHFQQAQVSVHIAQVVLMPNRPGQGDPPCRFSFPPPDVPSKALGVEFALLCRTHLIRSECTRTCFLQSADVFEPRGPSLTSESSQHAAMRPQSRIGGRRHKICLRALRSTPTHLAERLAEIQRCRSAFALRRGCRAVLRMPRRRHGGRLLLPVCKRERRRSSLHPAMPRRR